MSGIVNKIKDVLHKDHTSTSTSTTHGTNNPNSNTSSLTSGSTNHGGHNSNLANKADPRVDSDRDGSHIPGAAGQSGVSNTHNLSGGSGLTGNSHSTGAYGSNTTSGPHQNDTLNKLDPRVDSDNSKLHSGNHSGVTGTGHSSGLTGTGHSSNTYGSSDTSGPHSSDTANRLDPRVDSDNSHIGSGHGTTGHSTTHGSGIVGGGSHSHNQGDSVTHGSTNNGPHDSNLANRADPRVDSDHSKTGVGHTQTGGVFGASGSHATSGSGTAQNTSGPHNSDMLNKLDPRVDSDKDGSKTYGGNQTHA